MDEREEIIESLEKICNKFAIKLGTIQGIGAADKIVLRLFERKTKKHLSREMAGYFEICQLYGNITVKNQKPLVHCHASFSDEKLKLFGGHLSKVYINITFEGVIDICKGEINRKIDRDTKLDLMDF